MTATPEQIVAAKSAYEQAQEVKKACDKILGDLLTSHAATVDAYVKAKAAHDALKPATELAKAKVKRAEADVSIARAEYQAVAPKEIAAENAAKKGTGNKELLAAVTAFLATKPDGATNAEIYDALVTAGVEMAGADPRANLTSYLSRWGSAGSLVSKGTGSWGVVAQAAPPSFSVPPAAPQVEAPAFAVPPAAPEVAPGFAPVPPVEAPAFAVPPAAPAVEAPVFLTPAEAAPAHTDLTEDFPGYEPLKEAGYLTRESLAGSTEDSLIAIPGIGKARATAILTALAS